MYPNICTLFDVGPNCFVMELVEGPTLADRIRQGPISNRSSIGDGTSRMRNVGNLSGVVGPRGLKNPVTVGVLCKLPQAARTSENRIKARNRAARRIQDQN